MFSFKCYHVYQCAKVPKGKTSVTRVSLEPFERETCAKCVEGGKYGWCVTEINKKQINICVDGNECPQGTLHKTCATVTDKNHLEREIHHLANTCKDVRKCCANWLSWLLLCVILQCLSDDLSWCVLQFGGRKLKFCAPDAAFETLCPANIGSKITNCDLLAPTDKLATVWEELLKLDAAPGITTFSPLVLVACLAAHLVMSGWCWFMMCNTERQNRKGKQKSKFHIKAYNFSFATSSRCLSRMFITHFFRFCCFNGNFCPWFGLTYFFP